MPYALTSSAFPTPAEQTATAASKLRRRMTAAGAAAALLALTACGGGAPEGEEGTGAAGDGQETDLTVVTSIDVYADLVDSIAEGTVETHPIVDSTAVDPHSYEANARDQLAVRDADVIIANGGGYDSFITLLASSADKDDDVYQLIPGENWHSHEFDGTYENEHIWYDLQRMQEFVLDFAAHLGELAPENAEFYEANAAELAEEIGALAERNRALETEGMSYFATEAVSGFLLDDAGFENRTPLEFLAAVEHGDDVSPRLYNEALGLTEEIDLLSYNPQTETQQSQRIRHEAEDNDVVVVEFTETLPDDAEGFVDWMSANIDLLEESLAEIDA
ncbi:metal ABC transporter solute-binding protein, Zn/Mn family [Nesterenkonia flava]|uniref:Zinc ABC transporter substrate-binding protein n=1 Tax=Nesterenkonia flava TaxID=469799 RepID=A0ABU1FSM4_9MICC|nr:zinc ABC transporter substrate-binding protein [Nesterenkonia flava]MDR5711666.1 zinc ABC transporter substrate-binding protein [Nesterenkonia flava]